MSQNIQENFNLQQPAPLDIRSVAQTIGDRDNLPFKFEGLRCFVVDSGAEYRYQDGSWTELREGPHTHPTSDIQLTDGRYVWGYPMVAPNFLTTGSESGTGGSVLTWNQISGLPQSNPQLVTYVESVAGVSGTWNFQVDTEPSYTVESGSLISLISGTFMELDTSGSSIVFNTVLPDNLAYRDRDNDFLTTQTVRENVVAKNFISTFSEESDVEPELRPGYVLVQSSRTIEDSDSNKTLVVVGDRTLILPDGLSPNFTCRITNDVNSQVTLVTSDVVTTERFKSSTNPTTGIVMWEIGKVDSLNKFLITELY